MRKFLLSLALLLPACSHFPSTPTAPAHLQQDPWKVRALEAKEIPHVRSQPKFEFSWKGRSFKVAHGAWKVSEDSAEWNRMYGYGPVVWVTTPQKGVRVFDLRKDFPSYYVSHVFQDESSGRIYLFLDYGIEGPAEIYNIWLTEDGGEHWFAAADLKRPPGEFPPAALESFYLDGKGHGTAWFRLEATYLKAKERPDGPAALNSELYYRARTEDGGRSWLYESSPQFSNVLRQEEEKHD